MTEHRSSTEQERHHHDAPDRHQPKPTETVNTPSTPTAAEERALSRETERTVMARARARGVEWVRPTDLIVRGSAGLVGRGIDLHTELHRRALAAAAARLGDLSVRARRLPPLSAFGQGGRGELGPVLPGVGIGLPGR